MSALTTVTSQVIPLPGANIDTDQIIPAQHVNAVGQEALKRALFANRRAAEPNFVLNDPCMDGRAILLVGANFGCGSSREAAAWALQAAGVHVLIGTTFNETFANNCLQNALLAVPLAIQAHAAIAQMLVADPNLEVTVDLCNDAIRFANRSLAFTIDPFARELLLNGQDELSYLLARSEHIKAYEERTFGNVRP